MPNVKRAEILTSNYDNPILSPDEIICQYLSQIRQRVVKQTDLFSKDIDLFRLMSLMVTTKEDRKIIETAKGNFSKKKEQLDKSGKKDIQWLMYEIIPEMFVSGCVWEKVMMEDNLYENLKMIDKDANLKYCKVSRHLERYMKRYKKLEKELEGSGMISKEEYDNDIKSIKRSHKEKFDDMQRTIYKLENRLDINQAKHDKEMGHQSVIRKTLEEELSRPSQVEKKTSPNKAPDTIPSEVSAS
jgi:hypothetical protein